MKLIDLLNKIANREEVPKKFKYKGKIYTAEEKEKFTAYKDDCGNTTKKMFGIFYLEACLTDEVEIIEEDKEIEEINSIKVPTISNSREKNIENIEETLNKY